LPAHFLVPGREYWLSGLPYRGARLSLGYRVGSDAGALTVISSGSIANSSFEQGYTAWTPTGSQSISGRPSDGRNSVEFNPGQATPSGVLTQKFVTTPGESYAIAFDVGSDWGQPTTPQSLQVTLSGNRTLLSQVVTVFGPGDASSRYISTNFTFIADSAITTLRFADISPTGLNVDLLLDNVQITTQGFSQPLNSRVVRAPIGELQRSTITLPSGIFRIRIAVAEKGTYELQSSRDFRSWSTVETSYAAGRQNVELSDTNSPEAMRFYRIVRH
jgi:hypothetical protein